MNPYFVEEMSGILDAEKNVTHADLSAKVEAKLDDRSLFKKLPKLPSDFDIGQLDWVYGPVVQSGGNYDLRLSAQPDDNNLHAGVIIAGFGLRYREYSSIVARTYLVDPNKSQESNYKFLLTLHEAVIKDVREGAVLKDVYNKAVNLVKSKKPELEKHFVRNLGGGIGIEVRDATLVINAKSTRTLRDGMTLCVITGFNDIQNPQPQDKKSSVYSLVLADTVRVTRSDPVVFTGDAPSDVESTSFFFKVCPALFSSFHLLASDNTFERHRMRRSSPRQKRRKRTLGLEPWLPRTSRRQSYALNGLHKSMKARKPNARSIKKNSQEKTKKQVWSAMPTPRRPRMALRSRRSSAMSRTKETTSFHRE